MKIALLYDSGHDGVARIGAELAALGHETELVDAGLSTSRLVVRVEAFGPTLVLDGTAKDRAFVAALCGRLGIAATVIDLGAILREPDRSDELRAGLEALLKGAIAEHGIAAEVVAPRAARKIRVGFTFNLKRVASSMDGAVDSDAEYDSPKVIAAIRGAIESHGHEVVELEATPELPAIIGASGVDVVFNLAEGLNGRNREAQVPAILELLDIPYSGSDAATMSLALDKALAKRVVAQAGILTAPFLTMTTGEEALPAGFRFPAIVKPVAEGSSKGVLKTSVVEDEAELRALVRTVVGKYRQAALVETYLPGREFTVALLGESNPRVLPPMEIVFINAATTRPVYAFDHKLDWSTDLRYDRPANVDAALGAELERVARGAFEALGCRDVARVDLRLDEAGRVNFIEVNPLPGLSPGWSDLCLIAESAGIDYNGLIGEILAPALRRMAAKRSG